MLNFIEIVKSVMPYFLIGDAGQSWVTAGAQSWILGNGQSWFTGGNRMVDWLKSLVAPIQSLHIKFNAFVDIKRYEINLTGQVVYLEHYLNGIFDPTEKRIFISDGSPIFSSIIYNKSEAIHSSVIYNKSENEESALVYNKAELATQNDFIVNVPSAITLTVELLNQIKASVNLYKQAGSRYTIQSF